MLESIPGRVFVVGVCLLITTISYSSQIMVFAPALGEKSFIVLTPLNLLVLMVYYNYYLAITTDPGKVPTDWEPPSSLVPSKENRTLGITGPRFCKSCDLYKPPRSHHCRYCKRCVLKMDHHCPWINNCVGHGNYNHFLRFVFYVDFACFYVVALLVWRIRSIMDDIRHFRFEAEPTMTEVTFMVINFVLACVVLFCVGILSMYHLYCLARNQSTIEAWERGKVESLIRRGKIAAVNFPFDVGIYQNICAVLGNNPFLWLWPQEMPTDGLLFPVRAHTDPRIPFYWPPRDPDDLRPSIFSAQYRQAKVRRYEAEADAVDSEDYYDSGSCITDSDAEYSLSDEEQSMQRLMRDHIHDLSGTQYHEESYRRQRRQWEQEFDRDDEDDEEDEEDSVPLANIITRKSPGKEDKAD
ncbi:Palmitoyltransferase [Apophysomyces sp. BC1034]|nr:Palmitoyltransferase [Apophysomyces sp. BC1015]KAG0178532.1 Palmitoyltransferase [Apophysomyces sp. BC1021]KAG0188882.1 Palmitoyltransferase [Apophysomyces sp. BC1034]